MFLNAFDQRPVGVQIPHCLSHIKSEVTQWLNATQELFEKKKTQTEFIEITLNTLRCWDADKINKSKIRFGASERQREKIYMKIYSSPVKITEVEDNNRGKRKDV